MASDRKTYLIATVRRLRRNTHITVFGSYAMSLGVAFVTSIARIPLVVAAIGSRGYPYYLS
jgi:hypothetical protein